MSDVKITDSIKYIWQSVGSFNSAGSLIGT